MMTKINCPCCGKELGVLGDVDMEFYKKHPTEYTINKNGIHRKMFCNEKCVENYKKIFAIDYKGITMYQIDCKGTTIYTILAK